MEEELKKIGIELARLAKKYRTEYLTITYIDGVILAREDPEQKGYVDIFLDEEEVEKCLD